MSFGAMSSMAGSLPPNARYVTHRNECYDWGTLGWLLNTKQVTCYRGLAGGLIDPWLVSHTIGLDSCMQHHDDSSSYALLHAP